MNKEQLEKRILARGSSNSHCHTLVGDVELNNKSFEVKHSPDFDRALKHYKRYCKDELKLRFKFGFDKNNPEAFDSHNPEFLKERKIIQEIYNRKIEQLDVVTLRHLKESDYLNGVFTWSGEHLHIPYEVGEYEYEPQVEKHPLEDLIRQVQD